MSSPIIKSIFESLRLDRTNGRAVYLQLADAILSLIKNGSIISGQKLPSSREIAIWLDLNRITVSKAYEELQTQGWLESSVGRGTFVSSHIPKIEPIKLQKQPTSNFLQKAGFIIQSKPYLERRYSASSAQLHLDDGLSDPKLTPLKELHRAYRNQLTRSGFYNKFGFYANPEGSDSFRKAIATYLNETRGLNTASQNIFSVRGTLMGLNLVCNALISPGDVVVSGVPGWNKAEMNFVHAKAKHITIPVDENGLVVDELKRICKTKNVRMVYVTPHHHYPTTVSLRIDRRLELLRLANEYGFIIFEDDYDYDFHYKHRPLLPLASADENGMVIYCGSFSKSFSPAFRMGYLVASENVIEHLANVRILIDRQGDHIMDKALAELLDDGTIQRYIRKALPVYEERRNLFCGLLESELKNAVSFTVPEGGMTVWTKFDKSINLEALAKSALQKGLFISNGNLHRYPNYDVNGVRLGFASSSNEALIKCVDILKGLV
ncbi:aminotransferase-like domain-containing protein [Anaerophaga thermohalophila]|uniref:aminotransferase-like domain-containing protein n=1 Tax=Anaerophaga thermohalophila TaxID=177400 RepID=UPI0002DA1877|nr:PLP-dependent aminotransferase family protein [Anaerophaga thermohalophila]